MLKGLLAFWSLPNQDGLGEASPPKPLRLKMRKGHSHWEKNQGDQAGPNKILPIACGLYRKVSYTDTCVYVLHIDQE